MFLESVILYIIATLSPPPTLKVKEEGKLNSSA